MIFPTIKNLEFLAPFATCDEVLAAAAAIGRPPMILPRVGAPGRGHRRAPARRRRFRRRGLPDADLQAQRTMAHSLPEQLLGGLGQAVLDAPARTGRAGRCRRAPRRRERPLGARPSPPSGLEDVRAGAGRERHRRRWRAARPTAGARGRPRRSTACCSPCDRVLDGVVRRASRSSTDHLERLGRATRSSPSRACPTRPGGALLLIADPDERNASDERLAIALTHDRLTALAEPHPVRRSRGVGAGPPAARRGHRRSTSTSTASAW